MFVFVFSETVTPPEQGNDPQRHHKSTVTLLLLRATYAVLQYIASSPSFVFFIDQEFGA